MSHSQAEIYDAAVVGAGAAGLMAAVGCGRKNLKVLVLDSQRQAGSKILISGGTRCNLTHVSVSHRDYASESPRQVAHVLAAFPPQKAMDFFKEIGVSLTVQKNGDCFPASDSARTVQEALIRELCRVKVRLVVNAKVTALTQQGGIFCLTAGEHKFHAKTCILATGGLSYPATGSDGSGYGLAQFFGHTMIPTLPALVPLLTDRDCWKNIAGVTLPVRLALQVGPGRRIQFEGPFLFTHFGFSGPVVLDMSRHWLRCESDHPCRIRACFLPEWSQEDLRLDLDRCRLKSPNRTIKVLLQEKLPKRFVETLLAESGIPFDRRLANLTKKETQILVENILDYTLPVTGAAGYDKAEVTRGGIPLDEIDTATMESKKKSGLFLAGEILDADGRIGGFNFQWAWASAVVAAGGIFKRVTGRKMGGTGFEPVTPTMSR